MSFTWTQEAAAEALALLDGHLIYGMVTPVFSWHLNGAIGVWMLADSRFETRHARLRAG
jgi:hypothetical protein